MRSAWVSETGSYPRFELIARAELSTQVERLAAFALLLRSDPVT